MDASGADSEAHTQGVCLKTCGHKRQIIYGSIPWGMGDIAPAGAIPASRPLFLELMK